MLLRDRAIWNISHKNRKELILESYEKGEVIPLSEGKIWQVYRGVIQLSKINPNGQETILGWITPNHIFGNLFNQDITYRSLALADIYLREFNVQEMLNSPNMAGTLVSEFGYRLIQSQKLLAINVLRTVEKRLFHLLLLLAEEMGHSTDSGVRLTTRFTHQNLAKIICTTRVTITRILGDFQNRNWIEFDCFRHIIVKI